MPQDRFSMMLDLQAELQLRMPPPNRVPAQLRGEERASFVTWNMFAIEDELHEAIAEMGWKPWATSRHLNGDAMLKEMIDAWHFFMNVLLVIGGEMGWTNEQLADEFAKRYIAKNIENARRQEVGYDGVSTKCPYCHRELSEASPDHVATCDKNPNKEESNGRSQESSDIGASAGDEGGRLSSGSGTPSGDGTPAS